MDKTAFEDLASKIGKLLPPAPAAIKKELEDKVRRLLQQSFERMDLVTREEFEIQQAVLQRTRLKLEALSAKIEALEKDLAQEK